MIVNKAFLEKDRYSFDDLIYIMKLLRDKDGCPWDAEQNHKSIRNNFIEEVYEAIEAIDTNNDILLQEELGDVLLQVVFHAQIADDDKAFTINDVTDGICKKLILRHPHVFGDVKVKNSNEVLDNWDKIKKIEKSQNTDVKALEDVAKSLPSLMRAQKVVKRATKAGIISEDKKISLNNLLKNIDALKNEIENGTSPSDELIGSILMSVTGISHLYKIDAEEALFKACDSFIDSYKKDQI